jgi:hypothetical protein
MKTAAIKAFTVKTGNPVKKFKQPENTKKNPFNRRGFSKTKKY